MTKKKLMMMVVAVAAAFGAWAETETFGGYTWTYQINGDTAEIYKGSSSPAISPLPTGAMTIPSTLGGKTVTSIGSYAFYKCSGLTGVTIPDSVTSIVERAFSGCSGLASVTIPDSVMSIGESAFFGCTNLTSVTIPQCVLDCRICDVFNMLSDTGYWIDDAYYRSTIPITNITNISYSSTITNIGAGAFSGCSGLTSVTIPESVTSIGSYAFRDCSGLTSVTIPNSVTNVGSLAFYNCTNVTDVVVPGWECDIPFGAVTNLVISEGTTSIRDVDYYYYGAFSGCSGLTSVTIPDSVTSIGSYAFYRCSGLTSVTIPGSVTNIGYGAFFNCNGLMSISVADDNPNYKSINGLLLSKDGTTLIQGINMDAAIPGSVTNIGDYAFYNCGGLTSVTIPDGVTSIGASAFSGCSGLTSVTIPDSVTSLPSSAFEGCARLWTSWYRTLANSSSAGGGSSGGGSPSVVTTVVQQVAAPYALTDAVADRAIAEVTVDADCAIDSFVLKDGEVYDSVLYVSNIADDSVKLTLPSGFVYKTYRGTKPLVIPAKSQCMLSITRVADKTFLVSREELEDVQ